MDWLYAPWPWYVSGVMIALIMLLLILVGKNFGMSGNLRTICSICGAGTKAHFFRFDWKAQHWNLIVVVGTIIGGLIAHHFLTVSDAVAINPKTIEDLQTLGFESAGNAYLPEKLYFTDGKNLLLLIIGGFLVGFGARYAGGCTSGHAISGLSNLQLPSLIAVIGFFIGGLLMIHLIFPLLFHQ
ncbi:MAG: YeeE/YedE thiosulfate transporter family protein [Bacteroidota bacterium]